MLKVAEKYLAESNGSSDEFHKAWVVWEAAGFSCVVVDSDPAFN